MYSESVSILTSMNKYKGSNHIISYRVISTSSIVVLDNSIVFDKITNRIKLKM